MSLPEILRTLYIVLICWTTEFQRKLTHLCDSNNQNWTGNNYKRSEQCVPANYKLGIFCWNNFGCALVVWRKLVSKQKFLDSSFCAERNYDKQLDPHTCKPTFPRTSYNAWVLSSVITSGVKKTSLKDIGKHNYATCVLYYCLFKLVAAGWNLATNESITCSIGVKSLVQLAGRFI